MGRRRVELQGGGRFGVFLVVVTLMVVLQTRQFQRTNRAWLSMDEMMEQIVYSSSTNDEANTTILLQVSNESLSSRGTVNDDPQGRKTTTTKGESAIINQGTAKRAGVIKNTPTSIQLLSKEQTKTLPRTVIPDNNNNNNNIQYIYRFCPFETAEEDSPLYGSKILRSTNDRDKPGAYWLLTCPQSFNLTCLVQDSIDRRLTRSDGLSATNATPTQLNNVLNGWRIILFDSQDWPAPGFLQAQLKEMAAVVGWKYLYLITRSTYRDRTMVRARSMTSKIPQRFIGYPVNFSHWIGSVVAGIKHYHFYVRDDLFRALNIEIAERITTNTNNNNNSNTNGGSFVPNIARIPRPYDVAHMWDVANTREAKWRSKVSQGVLDLGNETRASHNLTVLGGIVGWRAVRGRRSVHSEYTRALLKFKIVVVSQRDRYQDHMRLFEALVCGAFVMSDPMVDFPAGLVDNETFSIYYGLGDMKRKILYFLEHEDERLRIANAGRNVALRRHREWHRWEDMLLGNWTNRDKYGVSKLNPGKVYSSL
jgi:hypothetical protein